MFEKKVSKGNWGLEQRMEDTTTQERYKKNLGLNAQPNIIRYNILKTYNKDSVIGRVVIVKQPIKE